jgi:flagellar hook-basal body complex protein FliE
MSLIGPVVGPLGPIGGSTLSALGGVPGSGAATGVASLTGTAGAAGAGGVTGGDFGGVLTRSIEQLQGAHDTSNELAVRAVTGELQDVHDYTIASSKAAVMTELTVAVRNKAVEAFTEIMRMPL